MFGIRKLRRRTGLHDVLGLRLVSVWEGEVVDADAPFSVVLLEWNSFPPQLHDDLVLMAATSVTSVVTLAFWMLSRAVPCFPAWLAKCPEWRVSPAGRRTGSVWHIVLLNCVLLIPHDYTEWWAGWGVGGRCGGRDDGMSGVDGQPFPAQRVKKQRGVLSTPATHWRRSSWLCCQVWGIFSHETHHQLKVWARCIQDASDHMLTATTISLAVQHWTLQRRYLIGKEMIKFANFINSYIYLMFYFLFIFLGKLDQSV